MTKLQMLALAEARSTAGHRTMVPLPVAAHIAGVRQGTIRSWKARGKVCWGRDARGTVLVDLGQVGALRGRHVGRPARSRMSCESSENAQ